MIKLSLSLDGTAASSQPTPSHLSYHRRRSSSGWGARCGCRATPSPSASGELHHNSRPIHIALTSVSPHTSIPPPPPASLLHARCDPLQCHCIFLLAGDDEEGATTAPTATRIQQQQQKQQHQHRSTSTRKRGGSAGRDGGRALMGEEAGAAGWSSSGRHHTHKVQEQQQQQLSHPARREEGAGDPSSSSSSSTTSSYIRGLVLPGALRRVNFFQQDKPLCLIPGVRYDDLVQVGLMVPIPIASLVARSNPYVPHTPPPSTRPRTNRRTAWTLPAPRAWPKGPRSSTPRTSRTPSTLRTFG